MRLLYLICMLTMIAGCDPANKATAKKEPLNGTWIPVREEIGGKPLPAAAFATQKLVMEGDTYTFTAESVDKGTVTKSGDRMDIYGKEGVNAGKHFMAIYKLENGELTICYNLKGDKYPEAFDSKGSPLYFLCVFKKE
ncbi:MAG: TIGR03067 domain-containing protein [Chitinophagaceae bacterium]